MTSYQPSDKNCDPLCTLWSEQRFSHLGTHHLIINCSLWNNFILGCVFKPFITAMPDLQLKKDGIDVIVSTSLLLLFGSQRLKPLKTSLRHLHHVFACTFIAQHTGNINCENDVCGDWSKDVFMYLFVYVLMALFWEKNKSDEHCCRHVAILRVQ